MNEIEEIISSLLSSMGCDFGCIRAERKALDAKEDAIEKLAAHLKNEKDAAFAEGQFSILNARPGAGEIKQKIIDCLYGGMTAKELEDWLYVKLLVK